MREYSRDQLVDEILSMKLLADLTAMGVPVLNAMDALKEQFPQYSTYFIAIKGELAKGEQFNTAMKSNGFWFPLVYPLFDVSESTGVIGRNVALDKGASLLERQLSLDDNEVDPKVKNQVMFYATLAEYVSKWAMPLKSALGYLSEFSPFPSKKVFRSFNAGLKEDRKGKPKRRMYETMEKFPSAFPMFVRELAREGENGFYLNQAMGRVADYLQQERSLRIG